MLEADNDNTYLAFVCYCGSSLFELLPDMGPRCVDCWTPAQGWFE